MRVFNSNNTIIRNISFQLHRKMEIGASGAAGATIMMQTLSAGASIPEKDTVIRVSVVVSKFVAVMASIPRPIQR